MTERIKTNYKNYEEYVELHSKWQEKLLRIADNIHNEKDLVRRIYWRGILADEFCTFLIEVNKIETLILQEEEKEEEEIERERK